MAGMGTFGSLLGQAVRSTQNTLQMTVRQLGASDLKKLVDPCKEVIEKWVTDVNAKITELENETAALCVKKSELEQYQVLDKDVINSSEKLRRRYGRVKSEYATILERVGDLREELDELKRRMDDIEAECLEELRRQARLITDGQSDALRRERDEIRRLDKATADALSRVQKAQEGSRTKC